jgi:hypothetical protein
MLSNLAMDQERKIYFSEIEAMGLDDLQMTQATSGKPTAD